MAQNRIVDKYGVVAYVSNRTYELCQECEDSGGFIVINRQPKSPCVKCCESKRIAWTNNGQGRIKHVIWACYGSGE